MVTLTDTEKQELERAVAAAETRTSAEIVLAISDVCDDYRVHTVPFAMGMGLVVLAALALLMPALSLRMAFIATGGAILLAALLLQWQPLRLLATPRAVKEEAAERHAQADFVSLVDGKTSAANGLLIYLALAEHHAEILPEPGLAARVPQETWQPIMDTLTGELKAGRVMAGIEAAIVSCADAAAAAFPAQAQDRDELSNAPQIVQP
jgi:putative membrane protein